MAGRFPLVWAVVLAMISVGCGTGDSRAQLEKSVPNRIVSMSPALTETLFELGLGDRVVGVTRYCLYPKGALEIDKIGGYLDPNWEAIVTLKPDLVVLMESHIDAERRLAELGIRSVRVTQHRVVDILDSIELIADACGVPGRGSDLRAEVESRLDRIRKVVGGFSPSRVMISVGRRPGGGGLASVWAVGPGTFLDDALGYAGGINVISGEVAGDYPEISVEGMVHLDPDDILDIVPELEGSGIDVETALEDWQGLRILRAVREDRVHILGRHYLTIPGPRVAEVVEAFARALHPEASW
jgi:iron complex transport system substrate-binding protein